MTLSSVVISRDWPEVSVLECILGGLHIGVDVICEPDRARARLAKSKIDALIVDCDLNGASRFLRDVLSGTIPILHLSLLSAVRRDETLSKPRERRSSFKNQFRSSRQSIRYRQRATSLSRAGCATIARV